MNRRKFVAAASATALAVHRNAPSAAAPLSAKAPAAPARNLQMHVGCQRGPTTPQMLQFFKRHGVEHICGYPPDPGVRGRWTVAELAQTRELCERHGVTLAMVALPFLRSSHIDREKRGAIMLADGAQRERDIADIHAMIEACAKVGIPAFKYNLSLLGVLRTGSTRGRGGARYSTWRLRDARPNPALTRAGKVPAELAWERITYFLDRVIPVCTEYKVRAACHPHDPGVPPVGFQGICNVLGTVEGLKRFIAIQASPYHGLNFCVGSVAEMLERPAEQIHDLIRYFSAKKAIFNIHFRNIRGHRDDFYEVYPDEGDLDMVQVARTLADVGYAGMLMPDHMPQHPDDAGSYQAFAYGYGYIKAVLQAIKRME